MHLTIKTGDYPMRKTAFLLTLLIPHLVVANPTLKPNTDKQRVAVIELKNDADLKEREVLSLTETARGVVAERLGRKYLVMTRENILSLVDEQTCNDAMAKSCEVEMGRTLGAHFIVSGAVTRLGGVLKVALKVHSTKDSRLLGVREGETQTLEGLAREIKGVAESAVRLIDGSTRKRDDAVSRELDALQESSNQLSANLELLKAQEEPQEEVAVDDDFQREIARLEVDAKERKAHKEQVARDFQKVREVALKNPKKGEVAIRLFMKEYGTHRLGNPSAVAAQSLLEEVLARLESEKRARLLKVHEANVRTAWLEAKPLVEKGGAKGEQALNLFLKAYENHPLGNPFESEARETLKVANFDKENKARAEHHKQVKAEWDRVSLLVKGDPILASKAIDLFLDRYKNHPLGNPLESEARFQEGLLKPSSAKDPSWIYKSREIHQAPPSSESAFEWRASYFGWAALGGSVLSAGVGLFGFFQRGNALTEYRSSTGNLIKYKDLSSEYNQGKTLQYTGFVVSGVLAVSGLVLLQLDTKGGAQATLTPTSKGFSTALTWAW
jgi:hypothetical protein